MGPLKARRELRARVAQMPAWEHSIAIGRGVTTPGRRSADALERELSALALPDLAGRSLLDIGAQDGYFAFAAERRGAARVGVTGATAGFALARDLLGSHSEQIADDFADCDLAIVGSWDVVLCRGLLDNVRDPVGALRRVAEVTRELAIVETDATAFAGIEHEAVWQFVAGGDGDAAAGRLAPNLSGLGGALTAAGFVDVRGVRGAPPELVEQPAGQQHYRAVVHGAR